VKPKLVNAALFLAAASLLIDGQARAADFQVNTFTAANQLYPDVARAEDGTFVVVWETNNLDGESYGIFGQRFDAAGARLGVEFQVNSYTTGAQRLPGLAMNDAGAFVVVWRGGGNQDGSDYGVFGRRFDSTGAAQAFEFQVNSYTTGGQGSPAVALEQDGDFVVSFETPRDGYGGSSAIFARRFDSTGVAAAPEFRVNSHTEYTQRYSAIATDGDGDFVVVWDSRNQDGGIAGNYGVFGQRFDSAGAALALEFQVNLYTLSDQFFPDIAAAGGGAFVVVWQSFQDGSDLGVFARRFDSTGSAVGGELQVNAFTTGTQGRPAIGMADAGDFLVAYRDGTRDGNQDGVFARRFDAAGSPAAADFQVNSYTVNDQRLPAVALGDDGGFAVVWQSAQQDGFGFGIFGHLVPALAVLDIDGDGAVAALTDGLLVLRFRFSFTGANLTSGAVGDDCTRCAAGDIQTYLTSLNEELDIDGDGMLGALTDGLLVLRHTFSFTGVTLTSGAVGDDCVRCAPEEIHPYLVCLSSTPGPC
jgi:hypothetical protein